MMDNRADDKMANWYTDDQIRLQLDSPAQRAVVTRRWRAFAEALRPVAARSTSSLRILDAGCGDGVNLIGLTRILQETGRPYELTGIDLSQLRVERARCRADGRVARASVTALPFASDCFDVVLCNHVIEHIPAPDTAAAEIARVLKQDGVAIIGVPNEGCTLARLRNHVLQRSILRTTDHVNFFTRNSLSELLMRAGLESREFRAEGFFLPHLRLSSMAMRFPAGRAAMAMLGNWIPSQAAGLIVFAVRKD